MYSYLDKTLPEPPKTITTKNSEGKDQIVVSPEHTVWAREDQQVLAYLLNNLSKEVLIQVASHERSHAVWTALTSMFASTSRSRINNLRINLTNASKGNQPAAAYFGHMRSLADELVMAGDPITTDQLISFIIAGLDMDYQPIVSALDVRTDPLTVDDLFSMVSNFDQRVELFHGTGAGSFKSSANMVGRGRGGGFSKGRSRKSEGGGGAYPGQGGGDGSPGQGGGSYGYGGGYGGGHPHQGGGGYRGQNSGYGGGHGSGYGGYGGGYNNNHQNHNNNYNQNRNHGGGSSQGYAKGACQICKKTNHIAKDCKWRYVKDNSRKKKVSTAIDTSYGVDTN